MINLEYFYDIHGLLKIRSNIDLRLNYFKVNKCNFNLDIQVIKNFKNTSTNLKKFGLFYHGDKKNNIIYYENKILGFKTQALLKDLEGKTRFWMNKAYYMAKLPSNLHNFIIIIMQLKLLFSGYSLLHSGCISYEGKGILISAFADTGKTTTVLRCLKQDSFSYLSDDLVIIDREGNAYCLPRLVNYRTLKNTGYLNQLKEKMSLGNLKTRIGEIPFLSAYIGPIDTRDIHTILNLSIKNHVKISKIAIIEHFEEKWQKIDKELAYQKLLIMNRAELGKLPDLIYIYLYLNSKVKLKEILTIEENIIRNVIENSDCYQIQSKNPNHFSNIISIILNQK